MRSSHLPDLLALHHVARLGSLRLNRQNVAHGHARWVARPGQDTVQAAPSQVGCPLLSLEASLTTANRPFLLLLMLTVACSSGADDSGAKTAGGGDGSDGGTADAEAIAGMPNGTFYVQLSLAPVGGLLVPMQAEVRSLESADGSRILTLDGKATSPAGDLSDLLFSVSTPLAEDGAWAADETAFVLPGAFSPTGSDVEVSMAMTSASSSADGFCGTLTGSIVTFGMDLAGSTFGAVSWEARDDGGVASCDASGGEFDPIEACPAVTAGVNVGFRSAELDRSFELVLPSQYDPGLSWPVIVVYHGLGGNIGDMLDGDSNLRPFADARGALLVVPQGADFGGSPGWDAVNAPPRNRDIQLFDDLLTCVGEQYVVDPNRVYATGMSNGGLMTGALMAQRSEVLAAAAPMSGGVITDWSTEAANLPTLITWGGVDDEAYEQDFNALNLELIAEAEARGGFYVACNHGLGHELQEDFWPWTVEFLLAHARGAEGSPFAGGLPEIFPEYCSVPE